MNVIVCCLDTLRADYLGCYGADHGATSHLDRFADRAVRFDAAYCGSFPTVPVRVDAYTGEVNWPRYGWKGPDADQEVFLDCLREAGFETGLVLDTKNNVRAGLHEYYDEYQFIEKPVDDGVGPEDVDVSVPRENVRQGGDQYARDLAERSHYEHERDWFVAETMLTAADWLEDHADENFFLWVDTFEPHEVWDAPEHYIARYSHRYEGLDYAYPNYGAATAYSAPELERMRARYAAEVTLTDRWLGHLFETVELLGLYEDTMVVVFGDHGMYLGERGRVGKHTVDPADPWPLYDEVARLPLLVATPWVESGRQSNALVQPADFAPTVLEAAGLDSAGFHGRSWLPVLRGRDDEVWETVYTSFHSHDGPGSIEYLRSRITVTTPRWSLDVGPGSPSRLFDRVADPGQTDDRSADRSDVVDELTDRLEAFMREKGATDAYVAEYVRDQPPA